MDAIALEGYGAFISGLIVFCGSVWLLLAVVLGSRLAYFITASVTLGFILIMSLVWSFTQLGPLGELPSWNGTAAGTTAAEVEFSAASSYPDGEWRVPDPEVEEDVAQSTEAEGAATEYLATLIDDGEITAYDAPADASVSSGSTRLIEQNGDVYAATLFQPLDPNNDEAEALQVGDPDTVLVVTSFDPGNPYSLARQIMVGTLLLFVLHLFGLSRSERKAREITESVA